MKSKKWLMKSEPDVYSIDHLIEDGVTHWEGIRNYQARNFMMNDMSIGDEVFFYHSNTEIPGIVGLAEVSSEAYPDFFAWDQDSKYFDPRSTKENPRWFMVDVKFKKKFDTIISLSDIKKDQGLKEMLVVKKGMRLSIQPVMVEEFQYIIEKYTK